MGLNIVSSLQIKDESWDVTLIGIMHRDLVTDHPSDIRIIDGGIGEPFVKIQLISPYGRRIMSTFAFFYLPATNKPKTVKSYFETVFDV